MVAQHVQGFEEVTTLDRILTAVLTLAAVGLVALAVTVFVMVQIISGAFALLAILTTEGITT